MPRDLCKNRVKLVARSTSTSLSRSSPVDSLRVGKGVTREEENATLKIYEWHELLGPPSTTTRTRSSAYRMRLICSACFDQYCQNEFKSMDPAAAKGDFIRVFFFGGARTSRTGNYELINNFWVIFHRARILCVCARGLIRSRLLAFCHLWQGLFTYGEILLEIDIEFWTLDVIIVLFLLFVNYRVKIWPVPDVKPHFSTLKSLSSFRCFFGFKNQI